MAEDASPVTGLDELEAHLRELLEAPETPLKEELFDEVSLQLTDTNIYPLAPRLLPALIQILTTYQGDPAAMVGLALKLLKHVTFTQSLTLASEAALIQALQSPSPSMNVLAIAVLEKAAWNSGDTAVLSVRREVVEALLRTWLSSPHVEVGERATKALGDLLSMDCEGRLSADLDSRMHGLRITSTTPAGQGLLWRRIFQDGQVYQTLFDLCSFKTVGTGEGQLNERQKSLAQARLLRILPRLATLNFAAISRTDFHAIEQQYGMPEDEQGLLLFAATIMVNKEEDELMHIMVVDFFTKLLNALSELKPSQFSLDYMFLLRQRVTQSDNTLKQTLERLEIDPNITDELRDLIQTLRTGGSLS